MAAGSLAMQTAVAAGPYLKTVGPAPLRFEAVSAPNPLILAELALPKPVVVETPAVPMPANAPASTMNRGAETYTAGAPILGNNSAGIFGIPAGNAAKGLNSASDLLNVTPQMIDEYFKSNRGEGPRDDSGEYQHGQSILVPAELGFVPPMPAQSHASYQSR